VNNTNNLDNFFSYVSKAVIIIPIIIVILSLIFKFNAPKNSSNQVLVRPAPTTTQTNSFKFDLKGPIVCDDLFIKDKKVFFKNKQTNYLLNGDCLYNWEEGRTSGEKKCGLSNYINMAESYLSLSNINDIANNNMVKDFIKEKNIDLAAVIKSCKSGEIKDKSVFEIPKTVLFSNKK
jgi:hypothetical protein